MNDDNAAMEEPKLCEEEEEVNSLEDSGEMKETPKDKEGIHSNSTDDSGDTVLVDLEEVEKHPQALQIVSIGTEEDAYAFTFHKEKLEAIIKRIPDETKVAVLSVVGAFRTGKSFLLCWFLRYLHYLQKKDEKGDTTPISSKWYQEVESLSNDGFHWRAGSERNTTGIWMWRYVESFCSCCEIVMSSLSRSTSFSLGKFC